jgi:hypothetical protein
VVLAKDAGLTATALLVLLLSAFHCVIEHSHELRTGPPGRIESPNFNKTFQGTFVELPVIDALAKVEE